MDNITKVVQAGMCVGYGSCLSECIYNPDNED